MKRRRQGRRCFWHFFLWVCETKLKQIEWKSSQFKLTPIQKLKQIPTEKKIHMLSSSQCSHKTTKKSFLEKFSVCLFVYFASAYSVWVRSRCFWDFLWLLWAELPRMFLTIAESRYWFLHFPLPFLLPRYHKLRKIFRKKKCKFYTLHKHFNFTHFEFIWWSRWK